MFEVGFSEMMLVALIALLVVGPKRLPQVARVLGRCTRRLRQAAATLREEIERELELEELNQSLGDLPKYTLDDLDPTPNLTRRRKRVGKALSQRRQAVEAESLRDADSGAHAARRPDLSADDEA